MKRALLLACGLAAPALAQSAEFINLPAGFQPANISDDGAVVVGKTLSGPYPSLWTPAGGLQTLRGPSGESLRGTAFAASADGAVVVGTMALNGQVPFRWTAATGMLPLADHLYSFGNGYGVSDDGTVAAGQGSVGRFAPGFTWDAVNGFRNLPFATGYSSGIATTLCGSGRFAAGYASSNGQGVFIRWDLLTLQAETLTLHDASGQPLIGEVWDSNGDGQIIVGRAVSPAGSRPVVWTDNGLEFLGAVDGIARRVSHEGLVVAGDSSAAWLWTQGLGVIDLKTYLHDYHGLSLPANTSLSKVWGVSADGRTMTGDGSPSKWYLRLSAARPSDFNRDEFVDFVDLQDYLTCFEGSSLLPVSSADLNRDGITDFFDLLQFLDDFER